MKSVKTLFIKRVLEIDAYFSFMESIISKDASLIYPDNTKQQLDSNIKDIFKANIFLMLYNLAESCIVNAIEYIHTTIYTKQESFDNLQEGIRMTIIKSLKRQSIKTKDFVEEIDILAQDIIIEAFNKKELLAGNLTAKQIKYFADKYGFSCRLQPIIEANGLRSNIEVNKLDIVKEQRNDLAHGTYSFQEIGKNYFMTDITEIKTHVIEYLHQILDNIETYLTNEDYLM